MYQMRGRSGFLCLLAALVLLPAALAKGRSEIHTSRITTHLLTNSHVIKQFLLETILLSLISLGLAILYLQFLVPEFSKLENMYRWLEGNAVSINVFQDGYLMAQFILFAVVVGRKQSWSGYLNILE